MSSVPFVLILVLLFFVLWPCISFAIEQTGLRNVNRVLAPAATILCILSMMGNFRTVQPESLIETVLIPWAALGYSILFVILLWLLSRISLRLRKGSDEWCERSTHEDKGGGHECSKATRGGCSNSTLARNEREIGKTSAKEF